MKKIFTLLAISLFVFSCMKKVNENEILIGFYSLNMGVIVIFGVF